MFTVNGHRPVLHASLVIASLSILVFGVFLFLGPQSSFSSTPSSTLGPAVAEGREAANVTATEEQIDSMECGDVLSLLGIELEQLVFTGCQPGQNQTVFEAVYRVTGSAAAGVEVHLHEEFGMNELGFFCCGWEPVAGGAGEIGQGRTSLGITRTLLVEMVSEETLVTERDNWQDIAFFTVTVRAMDI